MDESTTIARRLGRCPDRIYYQLNGKTPFENYIEQKQKIKEEAETKAQMEKLIEKELPKLLDKALEDLLKNIMR